MEDRDAANRGGDRDREQREHEELLAPLTPEHAEGPADHCAARGHTLA